MQIYATLKLRSREWYALQREIINTTIDTAGSMAQESNVYPNILALNVKAVLPDGGFGSLKLLDLNTHL